MEEDVLMPINVPSNPKIYTTKYENFRGVDFTNDPTNIWYRRSPTGTNMLPDAAGRPFKRHGWEVLITNEDLCNAFGVVSCDITKCSYFELAGEDHLAIFTTAGLAFYKGDLDQNGDVVFTDISTDVNCFSNYDRCFFFEGNGIGAFYIYGNSQIWRYQSDFQLHDVTSLATVPTVMIGANANCTGEMYEGYNLVGNRASVEYNDCNLFTWWATDGLYIVVNDSFKTNHTIASPMYYRWKWNGSAWVWQLDSTAVSFPSTDIEVIGTPAENDEIVVLYGYGVMLPVNLDDNDYTDMDVRVSLQTQFDTVVPCVSTLSARKCTLHGDDVIDSTNKRAWIEFNEEWSMIVDGEDYIKVTFPIKTLTVTPHENCGFTGTATLVGD